MKVRGFRIELGEIEARLRRTPRCARRWSLAREDGPGERRLVAYVVPGGRELPAIRELRGATCAAACRSTWCRRAFVVLERLPLTPNGKVDREALPAPGARGRRRSGVRGAAHAGRGGAGGDLGRGAGRGAGGRRRTTSSSWAATRCWPRGWSRACARAFGVELPLRALFEAPTVAELAARVRGAAARGALRRCPPIVPVPRDRRAAALVRAAAALVPRPAGAGQPRSTTSPSALRLRGRAGRRPRWSARWARSCARHEALRTTLRRGGRRAGAGDRAGRPASRCRWWTCRAATRRAQARGGARAGGGGGARGRSTWRAGPLLRARLLRLGAEEHVLLLDHAPHRHRRLVAWGCWSRELAALYDGVPRAASPSPLPALPVQYADYAVWQRELAAGEVLERQLALLAGAAGRRAARCWSCPPTARARAVQSTAARRRAVDAPGRRCRRGCGRWAAREGATLFMVLLAAFQALLAPLRGQDDVVVGTPIAGRTRRGDGGADRLLRQHAGAAHRPVGRPARSASCCGGCARRRWGPTQHQDVPFEQLVEELQPGAQPEPRAALPGDVRAAERDRGAALELPGVRLRRCGWTRRRRPAKFDLTLASLPSGGRARGRAEYAHRPVRRAPPSGGWLGQLRPRCWSEVAARPGAPAVRAGAAGRGGAARRCWRSGTPPGRGVPGRRGASTSCSRRRRRARPDAVAVVCEGERLTLRAS